MDVNPMTGGGGVLLISEAARLPTQANVAAAESHQKLAAWIVGDIIHKLGSITSP